MNSFGEAPMFSKDEYAEFERENDIKPINVDYAPRSKEEESDIERRLNKLAKQLGIGDEPKVSADEPKEGLRYNKNKIDLSQLSPVAQKTESLVFQYGSNKYARDNWKKFKVNEADAFLEFLQCAKRHLMRYEEGEWLDEESKQVHLAHAVWNLNRIIDLYYYGASHMKDGKDLYHQPLRTPLPEVPQKKE